MRRIVLASAATVSGIVLLLSLKPDSDPAGAAASAVPPQSSVQGGAQAAGTGSFTGDVQQTQYGPVQVRLTVAGGKITVAEAVQQPKGGQSDQINGNAMPKLNQAVVAAQSAQIDAVSGATFTSQGYKKSLQSAIDKMKASAGSAQGSGAGAAQVSGTFTGDAEETQYGVVQVRITVQNNKITKSEAVQAPKGGRSDQITADAVPKLGQAVVAAQSPNVDMVSGATYTSTGYKKSLQSAIDKANASASQQGSGSQGSGSQGSGSQGSGSAPGSAQGSGSQGAGSAQASGTFTGSVVQTQYGPVQVRVTVAGGKITKAEAVQQPKGGMSDQINGDAVPKLNQAAVASGDGDIDAVSGATYTSGGYKKSLQSALDQAGG
ncbi:FMN-binding protein [Streptomyces sp. NPDC002566]|uniref:FMN-binding protein n=1 Tax=Streptomyces sp. NPDC002566 TaxID=3364650 RepID=UPI003681112E